MKIIHLLSTVRFDSTARMALSLARHAAAQGHPAAVMCRNVEAVTEPLKKAGLEVHTAPMRGSLDPVSPVRLSKLLRETGGRAIIHVHNFADAVIASRARTLASVPGVKIVLTRHILTPGKNNVAATAIYNEVNAMIFPTRYARDRFMLGAPNMHVDKFHTIPSAVELPRDARSVQPVRDSDTLTLLVSGDLTAEKGLDTLLTALTNLHGTDYRVIVVGEGPGTAVMPIIRRARALGLADRIEWRGAGADIHQAAMEADVAVAPDKAINIDTDEMLTYMAHGLPVVASDVEPHHELADSRQSILLFAPGNADDLAEAILSASSRNPAAPTAADSFSNFASAVEALYVRLLSKSK